MKDLHLSGLCDIAHLGEEELLILKSLVVGMQAFATSDTSKCYIIDLVTSRVLYLSKAMAELLGSANAVDNEPLGGYSLADIQRIYNIETRQKDRVNPCSDISFLSQLGVEANEATVSQNIILSIQGRPQLFQEKIRYFEFRSPRNIHWEVHSLAYPSHKVEGNLKVNLDDDEYYYKYKKNCQAGWKRQKTPRLTSRERTIILYSSQGYSEGEVARMLCLSTSRMKTIKGELFYKLKVKNMKQAIKRATLFNLL